MEMACEGMLNEKIDGLKVNEVKTWYELYLSPGWKNWYYDINVFDNSFDLGCKLW